MRFAFISHADPRDEAVWSGIPFNIIRTFEALGHQVLPIGPQGSRYPFTSRVTATAYRLFGKTYIVNRDPRLFRARARLASSYLRRAGNVDAVIVTYPADAAYLRVDAPVLVIHDSTWRQLVDFYPEFTRNRLAKQTLESAEQLEKDALARADRLLYFSDWAARSAIADYGVDARKVSFAYPGASLRTVPPRAFVLDAIGKRMTEPCRLLFVGKDWYRKGGDIAVEIVDRLNDRGIVATLDVVGCTPPTRYAQHPRVRTHGLLRKEQARDSTTLDSLLTRAHFFVMPSRAECAGLVFCEAAAYGVPSVSTDVGGVPEIIQSGQTGIVMPKNARPSDYAGRIAEQFASRDNYVRMACVARTRFEEYLNWPAFCNALIRALGSSTAPGTT